MPDTTVCSALTLMTDKTCVLGRTDRDGSATDVLVWCLLGNQPVKAMRYPGPVGNADFVHYIALSLVGGSILN